MSFAAVVRAEARLRILQALAREAGCSLNSELIAAELRTWGINKPRAWVHEELRFLADMGAITLVDIDDAGGLRVATLAAKGAEHLARARAIEGVKPAPLPEA